jgi:hypothetical protein
MKPIAVVIIKSKAWITVSIRNDRGKIPKLSSRYWTQGPDKRGGHIDASTDSMQLGEVRPHKQETDSQVFVRTRQEQRHLLAINHLNKARYRSPATQPRRS